MNADRLKQIEKIYHAALQIQPAMYASFFQKNCGADKELRREVESLLSFEHLSYEFLENPPEALAAEMFAQQEDRKEIIGEKIKHYEIQKLLGKGGMGVVYLAEDTRLDRKAAIKFLSEEFSRDADKLKRFVREAKAASALNHPNILTVYEIGTSEDTHYIAAEFIDGKALSEHIKGEKNALEKVLDVAIQIVSALSVAHNAGIVHRDIKPDNVMIRNDGIVKVLDFGLAKLSGHGDTETQRRGNEDHTLIAASPRPHVSASQTNPGMIMGTPNYMSPEQARGKGVTHQTDIFSFGIVLYEMLSGALPFKGDSALDTIGAILHKEPLQLKEISPNVPKDVEFIVNKSLRKNVSERYQNADELLDDLRKVKQRLDYEKVRHGFPPEDSETQIFDSTDIVKIENAPSNNLTKEHLAIIGRKKEIVEIADLLKQESVRLLTLTGIGGTGKTRLAQAVARQMLREFSGGVFFVALASVSDSNLVVSTVAQTLGVKESEGAPILETLKDHLREKKILLVIDNFEQVIEAGNDIAELLETTDKLKFLITSREILRLRAEREFSVSPLAVPPADARISVNELLNTEAVRLFVERAQFAQRDFVLREENANSVAEICRRLDGLPLAIELAAARVKLFSPQAILNRLSESLKLLTGGAKDLPARQQTMRAAVNWSYELLDAEEKKMFNRLAVFAGGFTLEAAETVAVGDTAKNQDSTDISASPRLPVSASQIDIYDVASSLLDKSLLIRKDQTDGEPRFYMLVVVREFALEKLSESGESAEIQRRHTDFYTDFVAKANHELVGTNAAEWGENFELEKDNIRAALRWAIDNEAEIALQIATKTYLHWFRQGYLAEGCGWMTEALEKSGENVDPQLRAIVNLHTADLFIRRGDYQTAVAFTEKALELSRRIEDKSLIAHSLGYLSTINIGKSDFKAARRFAEEGLQLAVETNNRKRVGNLLNSLGESARCEGDFEAARKYYEEGLENSRHLTDDSIEIYIGNLACVTYLLGDYKASHSHSLEVLRLSENFGDKTGIGQAVGVLSALTFKDGNPEKAAQMSGAEAAIYESIGYKPEKPDQDFIDVYRDEIRTAIGGEAFDEAFEKGKKLNIEDAILLAREN